MTDAPPPDAYGAEVPTPSTTTPSHMPPQVLEMEQALLGAMMMSATAIEVAVDLCIRRENFYRPQHRLIFDAIMELAERDAVDERLVIEQLRKTTVRHATVEAADGSKQRQPVLALGEAGGAAYVMTLAERVPSVANVRAYAEEVKDYAVLRGLVEIGHEIARLGYEHPEVPETLIDMAGQMVEGLENGHTFAGAAGVVTIGEILNPLYDKLTERHESGELPGVPTGFRDLDRRWGGWRPGELIIVGGRPGMGKSAFVGTVADKIAFDDEDDVYIVNLEMPDQDQAARSMSRRSGVDLRRFLLTAPNAEDFQPIHEAMGRVHVKGGDRMHIDQARTLNIRQIKRRAHRLARRLTRRGRKLKLIVVDYLQLAVDDDAKSEQRTNDVTKISRGLKALAMELDVPVVALVQLNRSVENRMPPEPRLSDIRDSGAIEQDADMVSFLYRPEYYFKDETPTEWIGKTKVITAKMRNGQTGEDVLGFRGRTTEFTEPGQEREFWAGTAGAGVS